MNLLNWVMSLPICICVIFVILWSYFMLYILYWRMTFWTLSSILQLFGRFFAKVVFSPLTWDTSGLEVEHLGIVRYNGISLKMDTGLLIISVSSRAVVDIIVFGINLDLFPDIFTCRCTSRDIYRSILRKTSLTYLDRQFVFLDVVDIALTDWCLFLFF